MVSMREDWITFLRLIFVLCYILCLCGRQCYLVENSVPRDLDENSLDDDKLRRLKMMNIEENQQLADLSEYTAFHTIYLRHLLRVRVPGTLGHQKVRNFIVDNLKSSGWSVELDRFSTLTPIGRMTFTNIVAFLNPRADRHLALVAHYDSKLVPPKNGQYFLGATDSAVPCAMLLDFAKKLGEKSKMFIDRSAPVSPMLIFLDGEEAFVEWTKTDSLYGARHLAEVMSKQPHHNHYLAQRLVTMLDSLDAFVLLDLIGAKSPRFYDIYPSTSHLYSRIQEIELQLMHAGVISNRNPYFPGKPEEYFQVEDDHEPFLRRGVPILHLIHVPFPNVWHTLGDNESALDEETIVNLLHIFRRFLLDYFELM